MIVGFETSDDAGVFRLNDDTALITTADFITPPLDDPYIYGQIAAANAISDVYAMGGRPITCLNLVAFPSKKLAPEVLHKIIAGALSKITESGAVLAGGHTIDDEEPKFGLSVTGIVHPDKVWKNCGAKASDALILTKPIGSGVIFNANLKNKISEQAFNECIKITTTLNNTSAEIMKDYNIHAVTDVTGYGFAGHAFEMAKGADVSLEIYVDKVPVMNEALEMYKKGVTTGVNAFNRELVKDNIQFKTDLPEWNKEIFFDPQTSGGLLVSLPENESKNLLKDLHDAGIIASEIIGHVKESTNGCSLVFN